MRKSKVRFAGSQPYAFGAGFRQVKSLFQVSKHFLTNLRFNNLCNTYFHLAMTFFGFLFVFKISLCVRGCCLCLRTNMRYVNISEAVVSLLPKCQTTSSTSCLATATQIRIRAASPHRLAPGQRRRGRRCSSTRLKQ